MNQTVYVINKKSVIASKLVLVFIKFGFQIETKSYGLLGLEDNSNRDCEHLHTPPFKLNVFFYVKHLNLQEPRKTDNPGRRDNIRNYHCCVLFFPGANKMENKFSDSCSFSKSSICLLQSQPRHYTVCKKNTADRLLHVFSQAQQLANEGRKQT